MDSFESDLDENTIQILLNEGFSIEEAKNIIQSSHNEQINTQLQTHQLTYIENSSVIIEESKQIDHPSNLHNYLCTKDIRLLLKILKNIVKYPNDDKYKSIKLKQLTSRTYNYYMCMHILKEAGFIPSNKASRLLYNAKRDAYAKLKLVYLNLFAMDIFDSHKYCSESSLHTVTDSRHLLRRNQLYFIHSFNRNSECKFRKCLCLNNISTVLLLYNSYTEALAEDGESHNECLSIRDILYNNDYNEIDLLDDFHHLLKHHVHEFEDIYNKLNKKIYGNSSCDLSRCVLMSRNQRDRAKITKSGDIIDKLYTNKHDIISEQLLDHVHCYFFHTFDIGCKLTQDERRNIISNDMKYNNDDGSRADIIAKMSKLLQSKAEIYKSDNRLTRMNNKNNRFDSFQQISKYSYGVTYFYWDYYKNSLLADDPAACYGLEEYTENYRNDNASIGMWYVEKKYKDLKIESLSNHICIISLAQWKQLENKAAIYVQSQMVGNMYCPRKETAKYWNMQYRQLMSMNHVIVLMLYCNFDTFQFEFSKTFRKLHENEDRDDMKKRHSNFCHLARLLRECIECFGMEMTDNDITVFHGVNTQFTFSAMNAYIKGPLSTTQDFAAGLIFCDKKGMILEISMSNVKFAFSNMDGRDALLRLNCFDMHFFSDFVNEQEIFSIGGRYPFRFNTIIDVSKHINYMQYVKGLKRMLHAMSTGKQDFDTTIWKLDSDENCAKEKQMAFRLMAHEFYRHFPTRSGAYPFESCPEYISMILHINCKQVKYIPFWENETKLHDRYLKDSSGWINLMVTTTIFSNVEIIKYYCCNKNMEYWRQSTIFESTLKFLTSKKHEIMKNEL
eukprot:467841_1